MLFKYIEQFVYERYAKLLVAGYLNVCFIHIETISLKLIAPNISNYCTDI